MVAQRRRRGSSDSACAERTQVTRPNEPKPIRQTNPRLFAERTRDRLACGCQTVLERASTLARDRRMPEDTGLGTGPCQSHSRQTNPRRFAERTRSSRWRWPPAPPLDWMKQDRSARPLQIVRVHVPPTSATTSPALKASRRAVSATPSKPPARHPGQRRITPAKARHQATLAILARTQKGPGRIWQMVRYMLSMWRNSATFFSTVSTQATVP